MSYADSEQAEWNRTRAHHLRRAHGAVLRRHREAAGRSLADVAAAAQCSPAHLSEVERGQKDVSAQRLASIAAALDVPLHVLYGDIADELAPPVVARAIPVDARAQLELAAGSLSSEALRTVAQFGAYLASEAASSPRRRIGFAVPGSEK
ncbi:MAG: helix-turn-helix transcriptional regulator [Candidatus Dormibacteraeota bacterium]|nr:helix-turn-helix transcriptional regulator [Candidatus Dormibacteraeota bacterium]